MDILNVLIGSSIGLGLFVLTLMMGSAEPDALASMAPATLACFALLAAADFVLIRRTGPGDRTDARAGESLEDWVKRDKARSGA